MKLVKRYQQGGAMEAAPMTEEQVPTQEQATSGDPIQQIIEVLGQLAEAGNQALQSNDPNQLNSVVQGLVQFYSDLSAQLGGQSEVPTFKKGGRFSKMKKMEKPMKKSCK